MADVTAQRAALAETRNRIDARLDELVEHVPDRDELRSTAIKYGAAVGGVVVGLAALVIGSKSALHGRRARSEGKSYAKALLKALPEVADVFVEGASVAAREPAAPAAKALKAELKADAARMRMEQAHAERLAVIESGEVPNPPRGGVGSAVLMALGVIGGVAAAQALGRGEHQG